MSTSPEIPTQRPYVRADEGKEILVVEDHPVTMEFVRFALTEARYKVRGAASVAEALRAIEGIPEGGDDMSVGGTKREVLSRRLPRTQNITLG